MLHNSIHVWVQINTNFHIGPYFKTCLSSLLTHTILASVLRLRLFEVSITFERVNGLKQN